MAIEVTVNIGATELELEVTPGLRDVYFEGNAGGVIGPVSSVNNNLAKFGDTSGDLLADSGVSTSSVQTAISHVSATTGAHGMTALGASIVAASTATAVRDIIDLGASDTPSFDEITVDSVNFDIAAGETVFNEGEIAWDADEKSLKLGLVGGNHLHVGQEVLYYAENATASVISKGALVCFAGTVGNSGKLRVTPWTGSQQPHTIMGLASGVFAAGVGEPGFVVHFGKIRGINTTGSLYSESWSIGDVLYAKASGGLTKTKPSAPATIIAAVTNVSSNNGALHVRITEGMTAADVGAVALGANANTLGSGTATDGHVLTANGAGGAAWEAPSALDAADLGSGLSADGYVLTSDGAGGAAWEAVPGGMTNPMTQGGDLIYGGASGTPSRLGLGNVGEVLKVSNTGVPTWQADVGFVNPMNTPGDIIYGGTAGAAARLGVGANGKVLKVSSGYPSWQDDTGFANPMTASGDIIYGGTSGAPTKLAKGTDGQVLKLASGIPSWGSAPSGFPSSTSNYSTSPTSAISSADVGKFITIDTTAGSVDLEIATSVGSPGDILFIAHTAGSNGATITRNNIALWGGGTDSNKTMSKDYVYVLWCESSTVWRILSVN